MIKVLIKLMLGLSRPNRRINYYKTIVFNYLAFGMKGIFKMPILIYGNTKIYNVGKIVLECEMKRGLMTIGQFDFKSHGCTKFANNGVVVISNFVEIGGCTIFENSGTVVFKGYNRIADGCYILIRERFEMGEQSRIGFHSFVMDSDDHFTIDVNAKKVSKNTKPIIIGKWNWIASNTYIKKGVKTPDYLIVASANALLTKDYSSLEPYSVIGGAPAKLLKTGVRRIYNVSEELKLLSYFKKDVNEVYEYDDSVDVDAICKQTSSKF